MQLDQLDVMAFSAIYHGPHGAVGRAMLALTLLGSGWAALALLPMLWAARTRRLATALAAAIAVQAVLVWATKIVVGRVRPWIALGLPPPVGAPHDPSFPSGHAAGSFCVAVFLALATRSLWPERPGLRRACAGLGMTLAALVAFSRVYLGAHFPADVAGGALLGGLVGAVCGELYASASSGRAAAAARARAPDR